MNRTQPSDKASNDRRRTPRIELHGEIQVDTDPPRGRWWLADVSAGGVLLRGDAPLSPGERVECRLRQAGGDWTMTVPLEVVHVRPADPGREPGEFLVGCAFADAETPVVADRVAALVAYAVGTTLLKW